MSARVLGVEHYHAAVARRAARDAIAIRRPYEGRPPRKYTSLDEVMGLVPWDGAA